MGHGLYFTANRIKNFKQEEYSWQFEDRFQEYAATLMKIEKGLYPDAAPVLAGPVYFLNHRISLYTGAQIIIEKEQDRGWDNYKTKAPVLLTAVIPDDEADKFQSFIAKHADDKKGKFGQFSFYIVYVPQ